MPRGEESPHPCFCPNMKKGLLLNYRKHIHFTISYNLIGENDEPNFSLITYYVQILKVQHYIVFIKKIYY